MKKTFIVTLYGCLVCLLGAATFIEHIHGTEFVEKNIYHTEWFCCCWGVLSICLIAVISRCKWRHHLPMLLLHGSFLVILAGAMTTFLYGKKGYIHLAVNATANSFVEEGNATGHILPFSIRLDSFRTVHYPGTEAPSDYISYLTVDGTSKLVSMNQILSCYGYRLYQSSFDEDEQGTWLSVNYDPWGIGITYTGYILLGFSMCWLLISPSGGFRRLLRNPLLRKGGMFCLLTLAICSSGHAQERHTGKKLPVLSQRQADSLAHRQVIYQDRIVPFNTLARDFIKKLTGKESYAGLTAEQVMGGWILQPERWQDEPMIYIKNAELRRLLGLSTSYIRFTDLFDGREYRLQKLWKTENARTGQPSSLEKAILETDEKVGLILMLRQGTLIRPLPDDGSVQPLSSLKVEAELLYNAIPFSKILFMLNLTLGLLAFCHLMYRSLHTESTIRCSREINRFFSIMLGGCFLLQLSGYSLRWYIAERVPLSNGYETMQFLALCILLLAFLLHRRFRFMVPFGFLLSGFALLVSYLGQMNPQITPLMPVLVSPWLSIHVSFIMMSYALLAFILLNGILALCLRRKDKKRIEVLTLLSRLLLYPALFFLGAGIFIGAIWANVSWGRYWAWDPKEVWALITFLVYGAAFHPHSLPLFHKPVFFHIYMILAFLTVLMTYFGVNYFLGGMHSYANG